jgi:hypothetical protein
MIQKIFFNLSGSVSSVYRYAENGLFPHQKLGSNIRFTNEHIAAFLLTKSRISENQNSLSQTVLPQTLGGMRTFYDNWR